jgi:hypothetical protein
MKALHSHANEINKQVASTFRIWWRVDRHRIPQGELEKFHNELRRAAIGSSLKPSIDNHPLVKSRDPSDVSIASYVILRSTYRVDIVYSIPLGQEYTKRFRVVPWMPRPSEHCTNLITGWTPPPPGTEAAEG